MELGGYLLPGRVGRGGFSDHQHPDRVDGDRHPGLRDHVRYHQHRNQTAHYSQVTADQIGTAAGLLRSLGYLGSIASAAMISVVFHTEVDDRGMHMIGWIMVVVSAIGLAALLTDRSIVGRRVSTKASRR